jgi:hypothetical protein
MRNNKHKKKMLQMVNKPFIHIIQVGNHDYYEWSRI